MKKIFILFIIMCFGLCIAGCNNYEYKEEDFECIISVDKTNVKVGDTVKVIVTLKNMSGRNIKVKLPHTDYSTLNDTILIRAFKFGENHHFIVNSKKGPLKKVTFKKDNVIIKEDTFKIDELTDYEIQASIYFHVGKDYNQSVGIYTDIQKITVEE